MAVFAYCQQCATPAVRCQNAEHRKGHIWKADFWVGGRTGKRYRIEKPTKAEAKAFEEQLRTDYNRGNLSLVSKKMKFFDLMDRYYQEHCLRFNHNPNSSTVYVIEKIKESIGNRWLEEVSRSFLKSLQNSLLEKVSPATINRRFNVIKAALNKAVEWEIIKENPCDHISSLPEKKSLIRFLTREEIDRLLAASKSKVLTDYMTVLLHTGARPSSIENCSFDKGDVDLPNRIIWFETYKGNKGEIHRYPHPIDKTLYKLILERMQVTQGRGSVFDTRNIRRLAEKAIKRSKINEGKSEEHRFTIYGLRHCYASHLLMSGASLDEVRRLLGHTDTKMLIKHYGFLTQEYLRQVQSKINLTETKPAQLKVV